MEIFSSEFDEYRMAECGGEEEDVDSITIS